MRVTACVSLAALVGCATEGGAVVRVVEGRQHVGPFVSEEAYAAYAEGALAEAAADLPSAQAAYGAACEADPGSADAATRLAAVLCARGAPSTELDAAFDAAERRDPAFAGAPLERARCSLARGDAAAACVAAHRALSLDPDDVEPALLFARALDAAGRTQDADAPIDAAVARWPSSREVAEAALAHATQRGDAARLDAARARLGALVSAPQSKRVEPLVAEPQSNRPAPRPAVSAAAR